MAKVLMITTKFLKNHPKEGRETLFVEKIWHSIANNSSFNLSQGLDYRYNNYLKIRDFIKPKNHTIRSGNRIKEGDNVSIRIWEGKPYRSKQIPIFNRDIKVLRVFHINMNHHILIIKDSIGNYAQFSKNDILSQISENDGLEVNDFLDWFNIGAEKSFIGQIICWGDYSYLDEMIKEKLKDNYLDK